MSKRDILKFGIVIGETRLTSEPQTIEGYDLVYTTFEFCNISGQIIDGAKIALNKVTPPQLVVRGIFRELVKTGEVRIDITKSNQQTKSYFPDPNDNDPLLIEEGSIMQITNLGNTPAEIIELSLPGFEKCILSNL